MKPVSKEMLMPVVTRILILLVIAKAATLALLWFLPSEGVNHTASVSVQPEYHRYGVDMMLSKGSVSTSSTPGTSASAPVSHAKVRDLILKGLYGKGESGYVIVALKSSRNKTEVVGIGESFHGYKLLSVHPQSAVFEYRGTRYTVTIEDAKPLPAGAVTKAAVPDDDATKQIARSKINSYTSNLDRVWNDIGIQELRKGDKITGFKVTRIRPGTPFAELGLRQGDVIVKANNRTLDSYAAAIEIYKQIDTLKAVELIVLRNNQEKEIVYEIH